MNSLLGSISILLILLPLTQSTGIVWFRISASHAISARIEVVDKSNTSAYGISFDVQLQPNIQKELVLPMPSSPPNSPIPIFDYSVRLLNSVMRSPLGHASGHRLPLLPSHPWMNGTLSHRDVIISTSVRFECLPQFYGSKCQFFCPNGNGCEIIDCRNGKCQEKSNKDIKSPEVVSIPRHRSSLIIFFIVLLVFVKASLLISIWKITRSSVSKRLISESEVQEESDLPFPSHSLFVV